MRHWADRDDEVINYDTVIIWDDEDEEPVEAKGVKPFKIAETCQMLFPLWSPTLPEVNGETSMGHPTLWPLPAQTWTKS